MSHWLMKSEPNAFSITDLKNQKNQTTFWDGVRNYQARNMMRDQMKVDDLAFFYHSNCNPPGIVGIVKIVKKAYPDPTAFNPEDPHFDPKSSIDKPTWYGVEVKFVKEFNRIISLEELKKQPGLEGMQLLRKGNRLSVM